MAFELLKLKPQTPSQRHTIKINYKNLSRKNKFKRLTKGFKNNSGRNCFGRLTSFRKGGGHKKTYRFLSKYDLKKQLQFYIIDSIEYDPYRSSFINCCYFKEAGVFQYTLSAENSKEGAVLGANYYFDIPSPGSPCLLKFSQTGDFFYNINLKINHDQFQFILNRKQCKYCRLNDFLHIIFVLLIFAGNVGLNN